MTKIFSLQQRIAYHLLDSIESGEISVERAMEISGLVLEIIPDNTSDEIFSEVVSKLSLIPELKGLEFGL